MTSKNKTVMKSTFHDTHKVLKLSFDFSFKQISIKFHIIKTAKYICLFICLK